MFEQHKREDVESLMDRDSEFRRLYHKHKELDEKVRDAGLGVLPMDDVTLNALKKQKLWAKDKLTLIWERRRSAAH